MLEWFVFVSSTLLLRRGILSNQGFTPNPYVAGPAITDPRHFYGRQDIVDEVIKALGSPQQNVIFLHGQRRIGKTSLLYRLERDETLQQNHAPIFFDLQHYERSSLPHILADLAQKIADQLNPSIAISDEIANPRQFQRIFLPQVYDRLGHKRLLFLVDEFDVVVPPDKDSPASSDTLLDYLLTLIAKEQKRLVFVFVVGQRLDLLPEGQLRYFKDAHAVPVKRIKREEARSLLIELGQQGGINYTDDALKRILDLTNAHPYLTQLIGSEIFFYLEEKQIRQAAIEHVNLCRDRAMDSGAGALTWFWRAFGPNDRWILSAVADLAERNQSITEAEIDQTLDDNLLIMTENQRENSRALLANGDFLVKRDDKYQFAVEFIQRWIVKNYPVREAKRQMEKINPGARNIYQAGLYEFEKGKISRAIEYFRQAIELSPEFALAHLHLAPALVESDIKEAIDEYQKAYDLDADSARKPLTELLYSHARDLFEEDGNDEVALAQVSRALKIDSTYAEARQFFSEIYLRRASERLDSDHLTEALDFIQHLVRPYSIIQDPGVGQQIREIWLRHSQKLIRRKRPNWDKAHRALNSLAALGLFNETVRIAYNQITHDKARHFLEQEKLDLALDTLKEQLKPPPPAGIKELLYGYSRQKIQLKLWSQAEQALKGLYQLIRDKETKDALLELYREGGKTLMNAGQYDEARDFLKRGKILKNESD
jgi:branched-chain amino acid transport system substrate-binding protein